MAIETGLGWTTWSVDDSGGTARALVGLLTNASLSTSRALRDITTLDKSAMARDGLLTDHQDTFGALFDDGANSSFDVLKTAGSSTAARTITRAHSGQTLATESLLSGVTLARAQGGDLSFQVTAVLADGTVPTWA